MKRQFIIDGMNSWYDWRCTLTEKETPNPEPKTNYLELDGMSGTLDLSESLTGEIAYSDRTVEASFMTSEGSYEERRARMQQIRTALHGKKVELIDPDDPDHYFYGRVQIKDCKNYPSYSEFTIEAVCDPWRYAIEETDRRVEVSERVDVVICNNGVKTLCPKITVEGSVALTYEGGSIDLSDGVYLIADIKLKHGSNVIGLSGAGVVTFNYREAGL